MLASWGEMSGHLDEIQPGNCAFGSGPGSKALLSRDISEHRGYRVTTQLFHSGTVGHVTATETSTTPAGITFDPAEVPLDDPELISAVHLHLSRHLCENHRRPPGASLSQQAMLLREYMRTELPESPAPDPGFDPSTAEKPANKPEALLARTPNLAGDPITPAMIKRHWELFEALDTDPAERLLPPELVKLLVPLEFWPAVAALISDGPQVAKRRWNVWLLNRAAAGPVRTITLRNYAKTAQRLMSDCLALHNAHPAFAQWSWRPQLSSPRADNSPQRVNSVPLGRLRMAVAELRAEIGKRLKCEPGEELEKVRNLSPEQLYELRLFRLARSWAILHLMFVTASRVEAIARLRVSDYKQAWASGYSPSCPTILLQPNKTWSDGDISPKPLGGGAAYPLDLFLALREGLLGRALSEDEPLFPVGLSEKEASKPLSKASIRQLLTGKVSLLENATAFGVNRKTRLDFFTRLLEEERRAAENEGRQPRTAGWFRFRRHGRRQWVYLDGEGNFGQQKALLPFNPDANPFRGWSPHDVRKTASQHLDTPRARDWLVREKPWFHHPERFLSEILLNHDGLSHQTVEDRYKITHEIADRISGTATEYLNLLLYTNEGGRMAQSPARYRSALLERRTLRSQLKRRSEERERLRQQLKRGAISIDQFFTASDEIAERIDEARAALAAREVEIEAIREDDPRYRVPLPDDAPPDAEAEIPRLLEQAHIEIEGRATFDAPSRQRVRNWLTVKEFAAAAGVTSKQVGRWLKGESLPARVKPWAPDAPPANDELGERRRRIVVDGISGDWLNEVPSRRDRIEDLLCDWPTESNWHSHREAEISLRT